ncbi:Ribonuclease P protein component 3 [uncultured archaeon]|nr:Ribonuclease P protein component 3 [uncultured archaeon]
MLNLVQSIDASRISFLSVQLSESKVIVAGDFSQEGLSKFTAEKASVSSSKAGVDFFSCKILAKKDSAELQRFLKSCDFIAVRGSSPEMCSWAANSKGVDLLLQPFSPEKCFLDVQTANVLRDSNVFVCILFSDFLECDGFRLGQLLKNAAICLRLCENAGTGVLLVSGAKNESQLRASKDMYSFGAMLGMKKEAALRAVRENPELFLKRLKK